MEDYRLEQSGQEVQDILNGAAMQTDLTAENERAELAEQALQGNIDDEALARENADGVLQGHINDEETRAKAAEKQNADDIDAIEEKIPTQASSSNQLADKNYVEDLVSTSSATFRGTFNLVSDLHLTVDASHADIAAALGNAIAGADNNDFAFVMIPTSVDTPNEIASIEKYKFNGSVWGFEYMLNNSGFTAAQWAAINSGITSALVTKLGALPSAADLAAALLAKQDKLTFDQAPTPSSTNPVTSGGVYTAIDDEKGARVNADAALQQSIEAILLLIPSAATALNQLADKAFVNSSIATATATFRGTFNLVSDLQLTVDATHADIAAALLNAISGADNNDYAFVQIPTSVDTPTEIRVTERYKFNGTAWQYEYDLNNSGFTAAQWAAINSGITALLVTKLSNLPNATELATLFAGKQNVLTFDNAPVSGSDNPVKSGGLYNLFAAIDAKMPTGASANNKLVAEDRLAAYVGGIIGSLDATFDLTSTDSHVTLRMTQTDGVIASLQIITSDIASASALATLGGQVSTNADDIAALQALYNALQQSAPQVIEPSDTWPVASPSDTVIYRVIDRVNTPPQYYSDYMFKASDLTTPVLMATYNNAIDAVPTAGSHNLVESGGVAKRIGDKVEPSLNWTNEQRIDASNSSDSKIVAAGTNFSITDYIEIIDGTIATAYGIQGYEGVNSYPINFYDADKKWIGRSGDVKGEYCFNSIIPNGAVYVVLCQYITEEFPISGVKIVFEAIGDLATKEELEEKIKLTQEVKEDITQNDIDTISNSSYVVKNGSIVNDSALSAGGSSFMLFKQNITAIEFTIGELWDTNRFELCFGYGYNNEQSLCNVGAVLIGPSDYFVLFTVGDEEPGTALNDDARQIPIPIVSTGDRCMVEIVLDKYILGWVRDNINKKWKYWFMLNPTDIGSLCNPTHTRLRCGWNERIGIGLSVMYASAERYTEMIKDVKILSRKGTNLEIYHNTVRMGRKFLNRKWLAIGDSITAYDSLNGWGYVGYTSRRNMLDTINCGNSGWGVCEVLQKHAGFAPYDEINVDWETAVTGLNTNDVVSIFLGTNDFYAAGRTDIETVEPYRYPITLGTTDPTDADAKNPRTVLGALRLLIERLLAANPSVKIIVFAPFLRTDSADVYPVNSEGMTIREFSDAICDVAKEYYLENYNMCDYAGFNPQSLAVLTNDNLHPNQKGGERLGEIMARWIN